MRSDDVVHALQHRTKTTSNDLVYHIISNIKQDLIPITLMVDIIVPF